LYSWAAAEWPDVWTRAARAGKRRRRRRRRRRIKYK